MKFRNGLSGDWREIKRKRFVRAADQLLCHGAEQMRSPPAKRAPSAEESKIPSTVPNVIQRLVVERAMLLILTGHGVVSEHLINA